MKFLSNLEVAELLDPSQKYEMSAGAVSKAMSNAGIKVVHGWPEDLVKLLVEYRKLPKRARDNYTFQQWREDNARQS